MCCERPRIVFVWKRCLFARVICTAVQPNATTAYMSVHRTKRKALGTWIMCNKTTLPMLHRARVVPLLSLCRCENRPAASQPSSSAKMHWNTHLRTFPPSFGLPWGRVMGITGMFAPDYVPLFWEKCGLFCARGVNAENKKYKNEEAIQSDATARQPDCWQVSAMILNTIVLHHDEVYLWFIYLRKESLTHIYFPIQTFAVF